MNTAKEFQKVLQQEFPDVISNSIFRDDDGNYRVFGHYRIEPVNPGYRVYCAATEVGIFNSTKTALSWCIADKHQAFNTARDILELDIKLGAITRDITARTSIAEHSDRWEFSDIVATKLETKMFVELSVVMPPVPANRFVVDMLFICVTLPPVICTFTELKFLAATVLAFMLTIPDKLPPVICTLLEVKLVAVRIGVMS